MGARSLVNRQPEVPTKPLKKVFHPGKRLGPPTDADQALVTQFVLDQPREVTEPQVTSLSKLLRRGKGAIRQMIEAAREDFQSNSEFYVGAHRKAVETALGATDEEGNPDVRGLNAAMQGSQWAMENLSAEGVRVVDPPPKADTGPTGPQIVVGVQIGSLKVQREPKEPKTVIVQEVQKDAGTPASTGTLSGTSGTSMGILEGVVGKQPISPMK